MRIDAPIITGSFSLNGDTFNDLGAYPSTGSNTFIGNQSIVGAVSASALTGSINYTNLTNVPTLVSGSEQIVGILSPLNSFSASNSTTNTFTSSATARLNALETTSASVDTLNTAQNTRLSNLENKTGSLATTGSNIFYGTQTISGTVYIQSDLIVQGSSSIQNITGSSVNIGTNTIVLNTANPAVRYAGISVIDSGSTGLTGSIVWDSTNNNWLYVNPSGSSYASAKFIAGPKSATLGSEPGLVTNYIQKAVGDDHISSSAIYDDGTTISLKVNTEITGSTSFTGYTLTNGVMYLGGQNALQSTDKPHFFRINGGGLGISANNEGVGHQPIYIYTAGIQRLTVLGDGKIGIGVTNPSSRLSVSGSIESLIDDLGERGGQLILRGQSYRWNIDSWNDNLRFFREDDATIANGTVKMFISSSGYIGMGTTAPNSTLTIGSGDGIAIRTGGNGTYGSLKFGTNNASYLDAWAGIDSDWEGVGVNVSNLRFYTSYGDRNERMRIMGSGNVGIGTNGPEQKLHVDGNFLLGAGTSNDFGQRYLQIRGSRGTAGQSAATIYLSQIWNGVSYPVILEAQQGKVYGNAAADFVLKTSYYSGGVNTIERVRITDAGNIGVGTSSPTGILHLYGGDPAFRIQSSTTGNMQFGQWDGSYNRIQGSGRDMLITNTDSTNMIFHTNSTERVRITSGGNTTFTNNGLKTATLTKSFSVGGSSNTYSYFDIATELGVPSAGYLMVEISVIAYGGAGSAGANYKAVMGGYSGHTINSSYHKATAYVNNVYNCSIDLYNPNNSTYGIYVVNSSGNGLNGVLKLTATWY